jgi:ABC-type multidrug transport system fused ATPase/permease subunit
VQERPKYRQTFVRLLGFLRPYKWSLWISVVLAVLSQACQFVIAYLTGTAVAHAVNGNDTHALYLIVVAVLLFGLARALAMMGRRLIAGRPSASSSTCAASSTGTCCGSRSASTTGTRPGS